MKKKCPQCSSKAVRLYQNRSKNGRRQWIPVAWYCTKCYFTYQVASNTLIYKIGEMSNGELKDNCSKCGLDLVRVYRHKNPRDGKQQWISIGNYCTRCKYIWLDKSQ